MMNKIGPIPLRLYRRFPVRSINPPIAASYNGATALVKLGNGERSTVTETCLSAGLIQSKRCMSTFADPNSFVKSEIESNKVVIFSKTYCGFCGATKRLFASLGVEAKIIELDEMETGHEIQDSLAQTTGQRSVPNVFINGQHIGGNDATQAAARSGTLQDLLNL